MPLINPLNSQTITTPFAATTSTPTLTNSAFRSTLQGSKSEESRDSSKGFLATIFQPIGRFFLNLIAYFKHLCCCCPAHVAPYQRLDDETIFDVLGLIDGDHPKIVSYDQTTNTYSVSWIANGQIGDENFKVDYKNQVKVTNEGKHLVFEIDGFITLTDLSKAHKIILTYPETDPTWANMHGFKQDGKNWIREPQPNQAW